MNCIFLDEFCEGRLDPHHVIPRQRIRARFGRGRGLIPLSRGNQVAAIRDERNIVPLCRHHHELVTNRRLYLTEADLPHGIHDFAKEYGLEWSLHLDVRDSREAA